MQRLILLLLMPFLLMTIELISMLKGRKENSEESDIFISVFLDNAKKCLSDDDMFKQPYVIPEYDGTYRDETLPKLNEAWHNLEIAGYHFTTTAEIKSLASSKKTSNSYTSKEALSPFYRTIVVNIPEEKH